MHNHRGERRAKSRAFRCGTGFKSSTHTVPERVKGNNNCPARSMIKGDVFFPERFTPATDF